MTSKATVGWTYGSMIVGMHREGWWYQTATGQGYLTSIPDRGWPGNLAPDFAAQVHRIRELAAAELGLDPAEVVLEMTT